MDVITHGLLGGVAAQAVAGRVLPRSAWLIGLAAGMAPDLDVFIRPASDPLGGITYHRHFTHALAFIPIGALLAAALFLPWRRFAGRRGAVFLAALVGYATHGLLDTCTTYGTVLLWPFSEARLSWDLIGIIDPLFTGVLLVGLVVAARLKQHTRRIAVTACGLAVAYLVVGAVQQARVLAVQRELAAARGHKIERGRAMPTPINLVLWRSLYEAEGRLWADSVRVSFVRSATVRVGASAPRLTLAELESNGPLTPPARRLFQRFNWFADGYVAYDAAGNGTIGDMRYSARPDVFASAWGIQLPSGDESPAHGFVRLSGARSEGFGYMWNALLGRDRGFLPLPLAAATGRQR